MVDSVSPFDSRHAHLRSNSKVLLLWVEEQGVAMMYIPYRSSESIYASGWLKRYSRGAVFSDREWHSRISAIGLA
jgi:hypothetical protein